MPEEELELFSGSFSATDERFDRSVPTDARAKPAHPE
jgi:hypothetical protein